MKQQLALTVLGAVLYFLGFCGFGIWPLAFVCLVPLLFALESSLQKKTRNTLLIGFVYGFVTYAGGYHWMVGMLETFSGFGKIASILFASVFFSYIALQFLVFSYIYRRIRLRGWSVAFAFLPTLLAVEWWFPLLFPTFIGNGLHDQIRLIQIADLGGPPLVSLSIALVNYALFDSIDRYRRGSNFAFAPWASAAAFLLFSYAYGTYRIDQIDEWIKSGTVQRVGIVQVNLGTYEKRNEIQLGHERHLAQSKKLEEEGPVDLIVWPESSYMRFLGREPNLNAEATVEDIKTPVLFGGLTVSYEPGATRHSLYNSALITNDNKQIVGSYDKTYLLAFGEYIPFGTTFPKLYDLSPQTGRFTAGERLTWLPFKQWRITPLICYEDVLPAFARRMMRATEGNLVVNLTNDAWFGDSQEPWIHLALAQFRAVELRRYMVRATNSGVSAILDPVGRVVKHSGVKTQEEFVSEVRMLDGMESLFVRVGPWPIWIASVLVLIGFVLRRPSRD
ncbi:MAG: apolipoprotein N-acyltransferase [Polyangiales bacterium]